MSDGRRLIIEKVLMDTIGSGLTGPVLAIELKKCLTAMEEFGIVLDDDERVWAIDLNLAPSALIIAVGEALDFDARGLWKQLVDQRLALYARCDTDIPEEADGLLALIEVALAKKVDFDREASKGCVVNAIVVWVEEADSDQQVPVMDERLAAYRWNRDKLRAALRRHPSRLLSEVLDRANGSKK